MFLENKVERQLVCIRRWTHDPSSMVVAHRAYIHRRNSLLIQFRRHYCYQILLEYYGIVVVVVVVVMHGILYGSTVGQVAVLSGSMKEECASAERN